MRYGFGMFPMFNGIEMEIIEFIQGGGIGAIIVYLAVRELFNFVSGKKNVNERSQYRGKLDEVSRMVWDIKTDTIGIIREMIIIKEEIEAINKNNKCRANTENGK